MLLVLQALQCGELFREITGFRLKLGREGFEFVKKAIYCGPRLVNGLRKTSRPAPCTSSACDAAGSASGRSTWRR